MFGGRGGHPALVPSRFYAALAACAERDGGARAVLRGRLPRILVEDAAVIADIDEPRDLEKICRD
jgi:CTP:molybdopterin cytidylyltransferase MocA